LHVPDCVAKYTTFASEIKFLKLGRKESLDRRKSIFLIKQSINISIKHHVFFFCFRKKNMFYLQKGQDLSDVPKKTENLICYWNSLTSLEGISTLHNLREFYCSLNLLTSLEGISTLHNLQELDVSGNSLTSLEGIYTLHNLRKLYCSSNSLTSLKGISTLVNLQYLDCSSNSLTSLKGISTLVNLRELYCYSNLLTSLEGISTLHNLQELDVSGNSLTSLEGISTLHNLQELFCSSNSLRSFKHIPENVNFFRVRSNPIENIYETQNSPEIIHELSGTSKFLKLTRKERLNLMSYVKFTTQEHLFKLYLFF